jgi:hypothetical protein
MTERVLDGEGQGTPESGSRFDRLIEKYGVMGLPTGLANAAASYEEAGFTFSIDIPDPKIGKMPSDTGPAIFDIKKQDNT